MATKSQSQAGCRGDHRQRHLINSQPYCQYEKCDYINHISVMSQERWCVVPGVSLPAPSLRGRSASLRTFPDDFRSRISKRLISRVFSTVKPVLSAVKSIFLPALKEAPQQTRELEPVIGRALIHGKSIREARNGGKRARKSRLPSPTPPSNGCPRLDGLQSGPAPAGPHRVVCAAP
jgi:hypothetical protein